MKKILLTAFVILAMLFPIIAQAAVVVAWDVVPSVTGYNLYRSTTSGVFTTKLNPTPITALTYTDNTVVAGTTYFYVVRAINATGESPNSNQLTVTIPLTVPPAPANLRLISQ